MDILIISATSAEIAPLIKDLSTHWQQSPNNVFTNGKHNLQVLITGVGMVATTYALTKRLHQQKPDFIIQAGIGGSFDRTIQLGEVVFVTSDMYGDLGAEDHYDFYDVFELELAEANQYPFQDKVLSTPLSHFHEKIDLRKVTALSVNTVAGSSFMATARSQKYRCQVEGMEGMAFHYVCLREQIPFAQIKAISNYVEARDKTKWRIEEAVKNLNGWLTSFVDIL